MKTVLLLFALICIQTIWLIDLEDQRTALMNKVTSMQIQVARCEGQ